MDGFAQNNAGVLILGATNVPWAVDPAFRRPGRFDRVLFVPPPDREARAAILKILLAERPAADDIDVGAVAAAHERVLGRRSREPRRDRGRRAIEDRSRAGASSRSPWRT